MATPFVHLIETPREKYFFDVNQNEIVSIEKEVYEYLLTDEEDRTDSIAGELSERIERLKGLGYLSDKKMQKIEHPATQNLNYFLDRKISQVTLQMTQGCNLVCSYCAYAQKNSNKQRNHANKHMSLETAKKAIDFLLAHSCDSDSVNIAFYGGEPLIDFENIKKIIDYTIDNFLGKEVKFSMTTNGTLLSKEIVDYIVENKISTMISLDGPKKIHDKHRKFANGKGSFDVIVENLRYIKERYFDKLEDLFSINMVVDPLNDFDHINEIFSSELLKGFSVQSSIVDDIFSEEKTLFGEEFIEKYNYHTFVAMLKHIGVVNNIETSSLAQGIVNEYIAFEADFVKSNGLPDVGAPSGPCIPGQRRLFVDVDGKFYPCERVNELSDNMNIGNIEAGFCLDKVEKLLNIAQITAEACKNCWALAYCHSCARMADSQEGISADLKLKSCNLIKDDVDFKLKELVLFKECKMNYKF